MKHLAMRRSLLTSTVLAVAGGLAIGTPGPAYSASPDGTADLQSTANEFLQALDNLDWDLFEKGWSAEPSVFFPFNDTPERVDGKSAVNERFKVFFEQVKQKASGPPYLKLEPQELKVTRYGDVGLISFTLGGLKSVGGLSGSIGRRTILFVLEDGKWKVAHLHASSAGA